MAVAGIPTRDSVGTAMMIEERLQSREIADLERKSRARMPALLILAHQLDLDLINLEAQCRLDVIEDFSGDVHRRRVHP